MNNIDNLNLEARNEQLTAALKKATESATARDTKMADMSVPTERKLKPKDTVGRWTLDDLVISFSPEGGKRSVTWACTCSCSPEVQHFVSENSLRRQKNGASRSCGCIRKEQLALEGVQAAINLYFRQCKARAKRAGRIWELTIEQFTEIVIQDCKYCSRPKTRKVGRKRKGSSEYYHPPLLVSGIDRFDNSLGYLATPGQCVPCHTECNSSKSDDTVEVFAARRTKAMEKEIAKLVRRGIVVEVIPMAG